LAAAWKDMASIEDAIILNNDNHICEATASNIFMVKDRKIITPPLRDAPVDGIMRRFIIETLASKNVIVIEKSITDKDVFEADEIFLTNTLQGIQSVTGFGDIIQYKNDYTQEIRLLLAMV
jgi:branched-subunit amino acid aminotransferase/4-amino-4-deoxychorismate lyase